METQHTYLLSVKSPITKLVILGLASCLTFSQTSDGAVVFTISGHQDSQVATVTMSGFLTMVEINTPSATYTDFTTSGSGAGVLGSAPMTNPFLMSVVSFTAQVGPEADTASIAITDSSNGGAVIVSHQPHLLRYLSDGRFRINFPDSASYPTTIDAGDIATFSGSFDLALESNFFNHFVPGIHVGSHTVPALDPFTETVTVIVDMTSIPEPSTSLLGAIGVLFMLRRRCR
ncbi:MAG: hypothetical protein ACSHXG_15575 [Maribacter stanieri]